MSLYERTARLGCYRLGPQDVVTRELTVLQHALDQVDSRVGGLAALPFPHQWEEGRLRQLCQLRGLTVPEGCEPGQLRQAAALAWQALPAEPARICACLAALGVENPSLVGDPETQTARLEGEPGGFLPQREGMERFVQGLLPAGVLLEQENPSLTWALFDSLGNTVAQLEEKNLTWGQLDAYGQQP